MSTEKDFFRHELAIVESARIGSGTRIWAFAHIMEGATIGKRCNIGEGCFIESGVTVGDDVVIKNNVAVWTGVTIEDGAFLGPSVVLTNELEPRSMFPKECATIVVKKGASIGANSTIVANRVIGEYATIGAGSVVTKDVPPHRLVYGNPATPRGWMCTCGRKLGFTADAAACQCGRKFRLTDSKTIKEVS
ncbi:MAG TPA: acyltransferase [Bacteroidota bacterium]|nr:acyltransferase [Bacteroidota bacterium]